MKKKLLTFALLVIAIFCLLLVSVSAEDMNPDYNEQYVKTMTQGMTTVLLEDGTSVNLYDAQGYTLCYYWDDVASATRQLLSVRTKDLKFNFSGTKLSSIYYGEEHLAGTAKAGRIVVLNLRGVKNSGGNDITDFNSDNMFKEDSPLQHIFMPDTIEELIGYAFGHRDGSLSHLRGCYFSENSKLKCIKGNTFMNARQLRGFYIPDGVTYVGSNGFQGCHNAFFVNDPYDFLTKPDVYYFPELFYKAEGEAFDSLKYNLNNVLVFSADDIEITNNFAFEVVACDSNGTKPVIVFKGDVASVAVGYWNVSAIYFANEDDIDATSAGVSGSKTIYYCNAENNTTHLVEPKATVSIDATCETNRIDTEYCFCGAQVGAPKTIEGTALGHNYVSIESITYEDYSKTGVKVCSCANDNCDMTENQDALAIFTVKGYSVPVDKARAGISFRYEVNNEALAEYNTVNTALKFGVVGIIEAYTGGNELLTKDGEKNSAITKNMILADLTNGGAKTVDFVITGSAALWETKQMIGENEISLKDAGIIMTCYVCNGTDVQYIQADGKVATPTGITYTTVNASTNE